MDIAKEMELAGKLLADNGHVVITRDEKGHLIMWSGKERMKTYRQTKWGTNKKRIVFCLEDQNPFQPLMTPK